MAETNTRQASRSPVTLKIKFKSETIDQFIERYSVDISHGGIFIRTKDPLAVGTSLKFEFQLKDATPLITGDGTVVWTREHDPKRTGVSPGMGVRFDKLPNESKKILEQVLAKKGGRLNSEPEPDEEELEEDQAQDDFVDTPTRVAPAGLVDSLTNTDDYDEGDLTPLPQPMPFHGDMGDFDEDAFSESTRVASLEKILEQAKEGRGGSVDDDALLASTAGSLSKERASTDASETTKKISNLGSPLDEFEDPFADLNEPDASSSSTSSSSTGDSAAVAAAEADPFEEDAFENDPFEEEEEPAEEVISSATDSRADASEDENEADSGEDTDQAASVFKHDESTRSSVAAFEGELARKSKDPDDNDAEDGTDQEAETTTKAAVFESTVEEHSSSSMPWIAVAAVILLIGGAGGFYLLNKNSSEAAGELSAKASEPSKAATDAQPQIKDPEKAPASAPDVPTQTVAIATEPEGATVVVEGTELSQTSPASFDLEEGKTFTLKIEHPEFLAQSIEATADGSELEPIVLEPKPKMLRFTSEPAGAIVTVNGQRLKGRTPIDLVLNKRLAKQDKVRVQVRMPGHKMVTSLMPLTEGFESEGDSMVNTFNTTLIAYSGGGTKQASGGPKSTNDKPDSGSAANSGSTADSGSTTKDTDKNGAKANAKDTKQTGDTSTKPDDQDESSTDASSKKSEANGKAGEAKAGASGQTKPDTASPSEPTPDWMK